jgi:hypothetical protein
MIMRETHSNGLSVAREWILSWKDAVVMFLILGLFAGVGILVWALLFFRSTL